MSFLLALRFLSILPIPGGAQATERQLGRSTAWYPLVGLIFGVLLFGWVYALTRVLSALPAAFLCLAAWVVITGALHLDGLADSFDGLGAGDRAKRLAVMKDSRTGVFGVAALVLVLIGKFALLSELIGVYRIRGVILVPVLGRWSMLLTIFLFPTAGMGLASRVKKDCRLPQLLVGTLVTVAAAWILVGIRALPALAVAAATSAGMGWLFRAKVGGCTGDCYGAVCELSEVLSLLMLTVLTHR